MSVPSIGQRIKLFDQLAMIQRQLDFSVCLIMIGLSLKGLGALGAN